MYRLSSSLLAVALLVCLGALSAHARPRRHHCGSKEACAVDGEALADRDCGDARSSSRVYACTDENDITVSRSGEDDVIYSFCNKTRRNDNIFKRLPRGICELRNDTGTSLHSRECRSCNGTEVVSQPCPVEGVDPVTFSDGVTTLHAFFCNSTVDITAFYDARDGDDDDDDSSRDCRSRENDTDEDDDDDDDDTDEDEDDDDTNEDDDDSRGNRRRGRGGSRRRNNRRRESGGGSS